MTVFERLDMSTLTVRAWSQEDGRRGGLGFIRLHRSSHDWFSRSIDLYCPLPKGRKSSTLQEEKCTCCFNRGSLIDFLNSKLPDAKLKKGFLFTGSSKRDIEQAWKGFMENRQWDPINIDLNANSQKLSDAEQFSGKIQFSEGVADSLISIEDKIVNAARKYEGKLGWIQDISWKISDFKLLFWKSSATINREVQAKHERAQQDISEQDPDYRNRLKMCCWEFCLLVLYDAGIITANQIDIICTIEKKHTKAQVFTDFRLSIVHALYDAFNPKKYDFDWKANPPGKGDLLLFFYNSSSIQNPYHAAISLGGYHYIDLVNSETKNVEIRTLSTKFEIVYKIPAADLSKNIEDFIDTYQGVLIRKG